MNKVWIIAGADGAGKSSLVNIVKHNGEPHLKLRNGEILPYLNEGWIARKLFPDIKPSELSQEQHNKAEDEVRRRATDYLSNKVGFSLETSLSEPSDLAILDSISKNNIDANIIYVGTNKAVAANRLANKAAQGGYVAKVDVSERYDRSLDNFLKHFHQFNNVYVFDNQKQQRELLAHTQLGKTIKISGRAPEWFKDKHKELKLEIDTEQYLNKKNLLIFDVPYKERLDAHNAGLTFNSFIKKYVYANEERPDLTSEQNINWSIHKFDENEIINQKAIPALIKHIEEMGYHAPDNLFANSKVGLLKEVKHNEIWESNSPLEERIAEADREARLTELRVIPKNNDITAVIIDNESNEIINVWNYKESVKSPSQVINRRIEESRKEIDRNHDLAAERAQAIYEHLQPIKPHFDYLQKKQIPATEELKYIGYADREYFQEVYEWKTRYNQMVVPIRNWEKEIRSLQIISKDGDWKGMFADGEIQGNFTTIGKQDPRTAAKIAIVEGYATGASVHEATNIPVVVAFQTGNLSPIAKQFREHNPNQEIYFAADNDYKNFLKERHGDSTIKNGGIEFAIQAALEVNGKVIYPGITTQREAKAAAHGWDWNDYAVLHGKDQAHKEMMEQLTEGNSSIHESKAATNDRNLYHQIDCSLDGNTRSFFIAEGIKPNSGITLIEQGERANTVYPHAFIDQIAVDNFVTNLKEHGFIVDVKSAEKEKVKVNPVSENKVIDTSDIQKNIPLESMSPKIQSFNHKVQANAKSQKLTDKQMSVLQERLQVKSQSLHKQETSQQSNENEY